MATTQLTLNQTTLLGATTGTIACLLAPIVGRQLLLPNVTVAEVVLASDREPAPLGAPSWHQGFVNWRDAQVPVIAFEGLNGEPVPREYQRIAILASITGNTTIPFYGVAVQGAPRMAKVKIAQLEDLESAPVGPVEFLQVRYSGELAVIPDLDAVEALLA
ncbi:MAG: chemotaxis protein CheW [Moraxellaceae bacterium]|nr:chemotaxis protein CheW [Moraxellaceae bacterium]